MKRWLVIGMAGATALIIGIHGGIPVLAGAGGGAYGFAQARLLLALKVIDAELRVRQEWMANLEALNAMAGTFEAEDDETTKLDDKAVHDEWNV